MKLSLLSFGVSILISISSISALDLEDDSISSNLLRTSSNPSSLPLKNKPSPFLTREVYPIRDLKLLINVSTTTESLSFTIQPRHASETLSGASKSPVTPRAPLQRIDASPSTGGDSPSTCSNNALFIAFSTALFKDLWKEDPNDPFKKPLENYNNQCTKTRPRAATFTAAYHNAWSDLRKQVDRATQLLPLTPDFTQLSPSDYLIEARVLWNELRQSYMGTYDENQVASENKELRRTAQAPKIVRTTALQLINSIEITEDLCGATRKVRRTLEACFPNYPEDIYTQASHACIALHEWRQHSCKASNHLSFNLMDETQRAKMFLDSLHLTGQLNFLLFVCPTVDFSLLQSDTPEDYVQTSLKGSFLLSQTSSLVNLIEKFLVPTGVRVALTVTVGDSDEEDYMWPALWSILQPTLKKTTLDFEKLTERRRLFLSAVQSHLSMALPHAWLTVRSLAELPRGGTTQILSERVKERLTEFFEPDDISREKERMRELWRPQQYYADLPTPTSDQLSTIVADKFAAYAAHGLLTLQENPHLVLIQTEFPSLLRTKMINAGRNALSYPLLPAIYLHKESTPKKNCNAFNELTCCPRLCEGELLGKKSLVFTRKQ